ncbi:MAG: two-component regulator propeller domain-containing protein [Bryobacteraceae bacterium]
MIKLRLLSLLVAFGPCTHAERLPLKIYTAADGLAHNTINRIVRDSRGYLWFCTSEGLSRFDGHEFRKYGRRDGLPHRDVHDFLETRAGGFWIATSGGLCRYQPKLSGSRRFRTYRVEKNDRASYVNVLFEDRQGRVWVGTDEGLFRLERNAQESDYTLRRVEIGMPSEAWDDRVVSAIVQDEREDLWLGTGSGLFRWRSQGPPERYTTREGLPDNFVTSLMYGRDHRIWAATSEGICMLVANPSPGRQVVESVFRASNGLGADTTRALHQAADGTIFAGTNGGLSVLDAGARGFANYSGPHGLPRSAVTALDEDTAGSLWIGTDGDGAAKLTWKTFVTYTSDDGLTGTIVDSMLDGPAGQFWVIARNGTAGLFVNEFDGRRFHATRVNLPPSTHLLNWGARSQGVLRDRHGDWWIGTSDGIFRFKSISTVSDLVRRLPVRYTEADGLPAGPVLALVEDTAGTIWVSTTGRKNGLARWDPHTGTFYPYSGADGVPWIPTVGVSLFSADPSGRLWMGLLRFGKSQPEVARLSGSSFERFGGGTETPSGGVRALLRDHQNRLWVGTNQTGLMRFDNPGAERPSFTRYTTANGLSSDVILSLADDTAGRIYIGTGSGVDRLDVASNQVKKYTSADGLAPGEVSAAFRDRKGVLWFGTSGGISRFFSPESSPSTPPPIAITFLRVGGVMQPASDMGETAISGLVYQPNQNDLEVGFAGVSFAPGETLRYEYRLEGADTDWSPPSVQRAVNYANLSPGSYRFLVRSINSDGVRSGQPATIAFTILPPVWMRWWFLLLAAAIFSGAIYWLHRYRVIRLLEIERVRTRIATDLHDDIGSSLSQIAILSEVANRNRGQTQLQIAGPLADIAGISRELVDSMSDIVWATDPERDHLSDLVHRMRRFASDILSPLEIGLVFRSLESGDDLPMDADLRRQIFLIFKEALHNIVRHSGARSVHIDLRLESGLLRLTVEDDGRGFDAAREQDGHGLRSMRERTRKGGGEIDIRSGPGGTTLALRVRVGRRMPRTLWSPHK